MTSPDDEWHAIREIVARGGRSTGHFAIASVDADGMLTGRFPAPPGVRLYGAAGARRPATAAELEQVRRRVRPMRLLKGGRLLWSDFSHVRDITFTGHRLVRYPVMMSHLPHTSSAGSVPAAD